eukprot:15478296-Alexandrium_andersonii.AAC.1
MAPSRKGPTKGAPPTGVPPARKMGTTSKSPKSQPRGRAPDKALRYQCRLPTTRANGARSIASRTTAVFDDEQLRMRAATVGAATLWATRGQRSSSARL